MVTKDHVRELTRERVRRFRAKQKEKKRIESLTPNPFCPFGSECHAAKYQCTLNSKFRTCLYYRARMNNTLARDSNGNLCVLKYITLKPNEWVDSDGTIRTCYKPQLKNKQGWT